MIGGLLDTTSVSAVGIYRPTFGVLAAAALRVVAQGDALGHLPTLAARISSIIRPLRLLTGSYLILAIPLTPSIPGRAEAVILCSPIDCSTSRRGCASST